MTTTRVAAIKPQQMICPAASNVTKTVLRAWFEVRMASYGLRGFFVLDILIGLQVVSIYYLSQQQQTGHELDFWSIDSQPIPYDGMINFDQLIDQNSNPASLLNLCSGWASTTSYACWQAD